MTEMTHTESERQKIMENVCRLGYDLSFTLGQTLGVLRIQNTVNVQLWRREFLWDYPELYRSFAEAQFDIEAELPEFHRSFEERVSQLSRILESLYLVRDEEAINQEFRRYIEDKLEVAAKGKEKADKLEKETLEKGAKGSQKYLSWFKMKHYAVIDEIMDSVELSYLKFDQRKEVQRLQDKVKNERASSLGKENEMETDLLEPQAGDDCVRSEMALDCQSSNVIHVETEVETSSRPVMKRRKTEPNL